MSTISLRSRILLPAALALTLASWGAFAAPPEKESPIDKEPATQMTPETPPKTSPAVTAETAASNATQTQFDARDTNHDGYIDKTEAGNEQRLLSQFNTLDTDKDGKLSAAEFMSAKNLAKLTLKNNNRDRE